MGEALKKNPAKNGLFKTKKGPVFNRPLNLFGGGERI